MTISSLIDSPSELTDSSSSKSAIVLMTRVRLARNIAGFSFPGWAKPAQREEILGACRSAVTATTQMKRCFNL
jgi:protein arginine kinase